ncbi:MAG: hypothetical protein ACOX6A_04190 [Atribacter sp.]|jgi:hypothetical protein|uniref:hypothetical protein n=1 Tax=Atribacter sp. TaxID=2847780 RepID=UPI003D988E05
MKTMKLLRVAIACASLSASAAFATPADDLARIAALSAELSTLSLALSSPTPTHLAPVTSALWIMTATALRREFLAP